MASSGGKKRLDFATIGGLALALGGILGGLLLEGGALADVTQLTAAMIVVGGTLGAVLVTTPLRIMIAAFKRLGSLIMEPADAPGDVIGVILRLANEARSQGIVSIEGSVNQLRDPFLKKALMLGIDGTDLTELRQIMELEIEAEEHQAHAEAKVFEAAGGYAPTIGIIGAVLGLIQVMKHLDDMAHVGPGIAVAFVATVYGVGLANIVFLPAATKLKARLDHSVRMKELMLEGVASIVQGSHPKMIATKLQAYNHGHGSASKAAATGSSAMAEV